SMMGRHDSAEQSRNVSSIANHISEADAASAGKHYVPQGGGLEPLATTAINPARRKNRPVRSAVSRVCRPTLTTRRTAMNHTKTMIAGAVLAAMIGSPAFAQRQGIGESAPSLNTPAGATNPRTSGTHMTVRGHHSRAAYQARAQVPASGRQFGDP